MIALDLPEPLLWLLRWALFLGPLGAVALLAWHQRENERALVGGLFAFLYGLGLIFIAHMLAIRLGWWSYGGDALMLQGMPVDILFGGAILFGPVLFYLFPTIGPLWVVLPIVIGLHGTIFSSLKPLVYAGESWFLGVVLVFATAHVPAIYLARWTTQDTKLPYRVALLAFGYGFLAFAFLPSIIMHAMGGSWAIETRPFWVLAAGAVAAAPFLVMGLSAVQLFAVHGEGTPIPLDNTKRLVRTGIFAYVTNPMQLCTAAIWIILGVVLQSIWVASAALMAWIFVAGMVRWHHRHDLLVRFPDGWPEYRAHVPEWTPRWRPWFAYAATLNHDPANKAHARLVAWLRRQGAEGLVLREQPETKLTYLEPGETRCFESASALAKALNHVNFGYALAGAGLLLLTLPLMHLRQLIIGTSGASPQGRADA
jgi:protein-S-isoprenylcysteine O-methyltransferase Ste14